MGKQKIKLKRIKLNGVKTNYKVSSDGKIYSINYNHTNTIQEIKPRKNKHGYLQVGLYINGKCKRITVHKLVALTFIPNPHNYTQVNHIDGNKNNNCVNNLEWCSPKQNIHHAIETNLIKVGEKSVHATLTNKDVNNICKDIMTGEYTIQDLASKYNTTYYIIHDIFKKKSWKSVVCKYNFPKKIKHSEKGAKGSRNNRAKINEDTVINICNDIVSNKISLKDIAIKYNTTYKTVQHIYNKDSWKHIVKEYDFSKYTRRSKKS